MTEDWDGDEYGDELPVGDAPIPRRRRLRTIVKGRVPGTPLADVPNARRAAIREATGRAPREDGWRELLQSGERDKASADLFSRAPTHHSDSGFGLA